MATQSFPDLPRNEMDLYEVQININIHDIILCKTYDWSVVVTI